ncbi:MULTISPECIES: hypothetical protein [Pseudonocardia]|uniref:Uncharacterized protein n=2 Tax=Pseudonocardia TaxID=1847 RepID=A0A1Y2MN34_PSEAH|nr:MULTISPECIES: hypothetical protein [Pseudonocardia]OSY36660.1 hypothetical protein BG845_05265 [Pseudonocardia autotrophica]TDN65488.1 hypothetical protein C8E95_6979 [Pseudonocardia autotrophica]BBG05911.1 hypothetical protein Pdca_71200 [Pseudonocardia autotrophica]GEC26881.1 hypothetical protein PSA01_39100 [Pseudonocardia saturnea]
MTTSPQTVHQQIIDTLIDDPILAMLGFDHRTIGEERTGHNPRLVVSWADEWYGSASEFLGTVTIEPVGTDDRTRTAVLDRVEQALAALRAGRPIMRVRRSGGHRSSTFHVLARGAPCEAGAMPVLAGRDQR